MSAAGAVVAPDLGTAVRRVVQVAGEAAVSRLAERLRLELTTPRPAETLLVAIGGAGAGTSSVVAALLDRPGWLEAPGDALGYLVARFGDPAAVAHRDDGDPVALPLDEVARALRGHHEEVGPTVRAVEVTLPAPLLAAGTTVVDVPGIGGLDAARERDTRGLLDRADALLYVASAAAPMARAELDLLVGAADRLETVVIAVNRVDQFPGWREVVADSRRLVDQNVPGVAGAPMVPVSARLAGIAATVLDEDAALADDLAVESGVPALQGVLRADVVDRGQRLRTANLVRLCEAALDDAQVVHERTLGATDDAAGAVERARARLEELREAAGQAGAACSQRFARAREQAQAEFAKGLRSAAEHVDTQLAAGRVDADAVLAGLVDDLRDLDRRLERHVGTAVAEVVASAEVWVGEPLDATRLAPVASRLEHVEADAVPARQSDGTSLNVVSMVVSSTTSLGILSQRLATGGVDALAVLLGTGALLGAVRLVTGVRTSRRRREVSEVRARVRAVLDQVRAEGPTTLREQFAGVQRGVEELLRSTVTARADELRRQHDALAELVAASSVERERSVALARARLEEIERLRAALAPHRLRRIP